MTKQHNSRATQKLLKELRKKGFSVSDKSKNGGIKIIPPPGVDGCVYHTHATESAYHQIKRDFKKLYNVEIS